MQVCYISPINSLTWQHTSASNATTLYGKIKFVLRSIVVVYVSSKESDFIEQIPPVSMNEFCPVAAICCHGFNVVGIAPVDSLA